METGVLMDNRYQGWRSLVFFSSSHLYSDLCLACCSGKTLGRTKLTEISPKKTVEGAIGGLASSIVVAVALSKLTLWPATPLAAAGLGVGAVNLLSSMVHT